MSEERAPYRAIMARAEGPEPCCCEAENWLPVAARYQGVRELRAGGVTGAVVACRRCGMVLHARGIAPEGDLTRGQVVALADVGFAPAVAERFLSVAQYVLDGEHANAAHREEDPWAE